MESKAPLFKHNDIIWGKVIGHPWWPGIINQVEHSQDLELYRVDFFGNPPTHSMLPAHKIIKYEDYNKICSAETAGRVSPTLKKAISEASILYHTLQQSKTSPQCKPISQSCFYDYDNTAFTLAKTEQKNMVSEVIIKNQECQLSFSDNQQAQNVKSKKIKKKKNKLRINHEKKQRKSEIDQQKIQQILKQYKLHMIPDAVRQITEEQTTKIVRLIYKISRSKYSIDESRQRALLYKNKITNLKQLRQFIIEEKKELFDKKINTTD